MSSQKEGYMRESGSKGGGNVWALLQQRVCAAEMILNYSGGVGGLLKLLTTTNPTSSTHHGPCAPMLNEMPHSLDQQRHMAPWSVPQHNQV
jgi:hypothetical protein